MLLAVIADVTMATTFPDFFPTTETNNPPISTIQRVTTGLFLTTITPDI